MHQNIEHFDKKLAKNDHVETKIVLPGLLNGKSEQLPRVGSKDITSPITKKSIINKSLRGIQIQKGVWLIKVKHSNG